MKITPSMTAIVTGGCSGEVGEAIMENGLLHVDLTQARPETIVQTIQIKKG